MGLLQLVAQPSDRSIVSGPMRIHLAGRPWRRWIEQEDQSLHIVLPCLAVFELGEGLFLTRCDRPIPPGEETDVEIRAAHILEAALERAPLFCAVGLHGDNLEPQLFQLVSRRSAVQLQILEARGEIDSLSWFIHPYTAH